MELATCNGRELALGRSSVGVGSVKWGCLIGKWVTVGSETNSKGIGFTSVTACGRVGHKFSSDLGSVENGSFATEPAV